MNEQEELERLRAIPTWWNRLYPETRIHVMFDLIRQPIEVATRLSEFTWADLPVAIKEDIVAYFVLHKPPERSGGGEPPSLDLRAWWNGMLGSERYEFLVKLPIERELVDEWANLSWDRLPDYARKEIEKAIRREVERLLIELVKRGGTLRLKMASPEKSGSSSDLGKYLYEVVDYKGNVYLFWGDYPEEAIQKAREKGISVKEIYVKRRRTATEESSSNPTEEITSILDYRLTILYDPAYCHTEAYQRVPNDIRQRVNRLLIERNVCPEARVYEIDAEIIQLLRPYVSEEQKSSNPTSHGKSGGWS